MRTSAGIVAASICAFAIVPVSCHTAVQQLTYYKDVKAIFDSKCISCHTEGGIAPFSLETPDLAIANRYLIRSSVIARTMPPWLANDSCGQYSNDRSLTDAQIQTIASWVDTGAVVGSAADAPSVPLAPGGLSHVDFGMQVPAPYTPNVTPDDYRCFDLKWPETTPVYVTGFQIRPGDQRIVHHSVAFIATPSQAAEVDAMDGQDGSAGYPCFGGPGISTGIPSLLGVWAPGSSGVQFPAGTGILMQPGSRIVLQIHYNTLNSPPAPDQTSMDIETAASVNKAAIILPFTSPSWLEGDMPIAAGDPDASYVFQFDVSQALSAFGNFADGNEFTMYIGGLHAHWLATHVSTWIQRKNGEQTCLIDIPQWNFNWQSAYNFANPITFYPGDQLALECHWNNTQANQPVADGVQREVADVNWGEFSTDEMCMSFYYITQ